jgi:hypothetical protein
MSSYRRKQLFNRRARRAIIVQAGAITVAGAAVLAVMGVTHLRDDPATAGGDPNNIKLQLVAAPTVTRSQMIANARTWNPGTPQRIPYSQTAYHNGYRTDCSGYVSMTLGLPQPGTNTVGLASSQFSRPISIPELQTGDLMIDALGNNVTRHVVIFEKWANSAKTAYWAFEQRGSFGTDYRVRSYGLEPGSEYKPYRPLNLRDDAASAPRPVVQKPPARNLTPEPKKKSKKPTAKPAPRLAEPESSRARRAIVIARAKAWRPHTGDRVAYSQTVTHGGYRTDGSGYASMALVLPAPGPWSGALASPSLTHPIPMSKLKPGDLVIDAVGDENNRHVVIFHKWANKSKTAYWAFQQRRDYGTDHLILSEGLKKGSEFKAFRRNGLR